MLQIMPLKDSVLVDLPEKGRVEFTRTELETGVLEEKTALKDVEDFTFLNEMKMWRWCAWSHQNPEAKPSGRRDRRSDRSRQSGQSQNVNTRDGQGSSREQNPQNSRGQRQDRNNSQQTRQDQAGQPQEQRKSNSGRRRKSRPQRDQSTNNPPKQE